MISPSTKEYSVFTRYNEAVLVILPITRRPSATTAGSELKSRSNRTICAACSVASAPPPMAMEQSAALSEGMSFTPSPVMATLCPSALSASTKICFRAGVSRPKITLSAAAARSSSSLRREQSAIRSAPGSSSVRATAETVRGSSPERTRTETPSRENQARVSLTEGRSVSRRRKRPRQRRTGGSSVPEIAPSASARASTR